MLIRNMKLFLMTIGVFDVFISVNELKCKKKTFIWQTRNYFKIKIIMFAYQVII